MRKGAGGCSLLPFDAREYNWGVVASFLLEKIKPRGLEPPSCWCWRTQLEIGASSTEECSYPNVRA